MWRFFIKKEMNGYGHTWSSQTFMFCPYCFEKNSFYTQLPENECKECKRKMPFPSAMARELEDRIEYHLGEYKCSH